MSLFDALNNLAAGRCWCGAEPRTHLRHSAGGGEWACSKKHQSAWWRQFEFWHDVRYRALRRAEWRCAACGKSTRDWMQCDHIIPITDGGPMWAADNLQVLCADCHTVKTASDSTRRAARRRRERLGCRPLEAYCDDMSKQEPAHA